MKKTIGIGIETPRKECKDRKCPFHGKLTVKGRSVRGWIIRLSSTRTGTIQWQRAYYIQKYERYEKRRSRLHVHLPACLNINVGDKVKAVQTRPISKTKNFVVVEVIK